MPSVIHFHRELQSAVLHIGIMRLTKFYLSGLLSFAILGVTRGQKLTCAKDESKSNQHIAKNEAASNKLAPVEYGLTEIKPRLVFSVKPNTKKLSGKNENIEAIREKLMKTLLEKGEIKNVSLGINSEEAANRNHMKSKHQEVWALMDEIMKRKNFLRKEIEEFYKRGFPKTRKRDEPADSEQTDVNSDEDYSEENLSDEGNNSESEELPDERVSFGRRYKKSKRKSNYEAEPTLEMSRKFKKQKFPKTEKYPQEAAAVVEEASDEATDIERIENERRNKNMQLSKLFVQQMKEIYDMENKSRKVQRTKRHYESQIPFPYEISQESESIEESVEQPKTKSSKKRPAIKKKFYIIDNDPLGFYYYFKHSQKRNPNPVKLYPAIELSSTEVRKKKSSKKRSQQLKKKRLAKKKSRLEKEGILIKQIEEKHVNNPVKSVYFENHLLPQSTQLQAKYLYLNGNKVNWNTKDRPIPNSEFGDFHDFESKENSIECGPVSQEIRKIDLPSEDKFICAPESDILIINNQKNNETELVAVPPKSVIANSTTSQFEDPQLQQSIEDQQSLDDTPKIRVPRSCRSSPFRNHLEAGGDCDEFCSSEREQKYELRDDPDHLDEINLYLSLLKKLFDDKSLEDLLPEATATESSAPITTTATATATAIEGGTTATEGGTTLTDCSAKSDIVDTKSTETSTAVSTTPIVVSPGNYGLNLDQIADEINEAIGSEHSDKFVPFEEPLVVSPDQPREKNEQSLLLKRPKGFWLPLKLVQNVDGQFNIQLDLKYICRRCTKEKQKRKRKQQKFGSYEFY